MSSKPKYYATDKFKSKREELQYTQAQLADWLSLELGISISVYMVQKWEQGRVPMNSDTAMRVAGLFQMPIVELVKRQP